MPYRINSPPPKDPIPPMSFEDKYPIIYKVLNKLLVLTVGSVITASALWLLFPGAYRIGLWTSNQLNWGRGLNPDSTDPACWLIGLFYLVGPVVFYYAANAIGNKVFERFSK